MPKPLCMWRAFLSRHGPCSHNTQYKSLRPDWLPHCRDFIQSKLTSLLRVHLSCAHTQTQIKTLTHKDSPLNPCDVMGAGEETQEVINNRLFSQEKRKLSRGAVGTCGIHQSIPSTFNTLWAIHHVSHDCQDVSLFLCFALPLLFPLFPPLSPTLLFCPPHRFGILREFSLVMNTSRVFICESFLWSVSWRGGWPQR